MTCSAEELLFPGITLALFGVVVGVVICELARRARRGGR